MLGAKRNWQQEKSLNVQWPQLYEKPTPKNQRRFRQHSPGLQQMISQQPLHCACPNAMQHQQVLPNASQLRSETVLCYELQCGHCVGKIVCSCRITWLNCGTQRFGVSVHAHAWRQEVYTQCLPWFFSTLYFETVSSTETGTHQLLDQLASKPWGSSCLGVCNAGAQVCTATPSFV